MLFVRQKVGFRASLILRDQYLAFSFNHSLFPQKNFGVDGKVNNQLLIVYFQTIYFVGLIIKSHLFLSLNLKHRQDNQE